MILQPEGTINVSNIDGVDNLYNSESDGVVYSPEVQEYIRNLTRIANEVRGLGELEQKLIKEFGEGKIQGSGKIRFANVFGFQNTIIRRHVENIILHDGETDMPTTTNMGGNVIDPIAWSSKPIAPSSGYGLFGKIPQLRPNNDNFDEELHTEIMNRPIKLHSKGIALEVGPDETALMPIFSIVGADDLISQFNQEKKDSDTPTAKYYGINS